MKTLHELVGEFAENVGAHTRAIRRGDADASNRYARKYYIEAFRQLRAYGDQGREALTVLLRHERLDVWAMVAACLRQYRTAEATRVLRELAQGKGLVSFGAEGALKRWKAGTWKLDLEDEKPPEKR